MAPYSSFRYPWIPNKITYEMLLRISDNTEYCDFQQMPRRYGGAKGAKWCVFSEDCKHPYSKDCKKLPYLEDRLAFFESMFICYKCCNRHGGQFQCNTSGSCGYCRHNENLVCYSRSHHSSICPFSTELRRPLDSCPNPHCANVRFRTGKRDGFIICARCKIVVG